MKSALNYVSTPAFLPILYGDLGIFYRTVWTLGLLSMQGLLANPIPNMPRFTRISAELTWKKRNANKFAGEVILENDQFGDGEGN
jgi:hypothetical protein